MDVKVTLLITALNKPEMMRTTNKFARISRDPIPQSAMDQLLLLPADSACFTPDNSISSALSFDNCYDEDDDGGRLFRSSPTSAGSTGTSNHEVFSNMNSNRFPFK